MKPFSLLAGLLLVTALPLWSQTDAGLSPEDMAFLKQCGVSGEDLAAVAEFSPEGRQKLKAAAGKRICLNPEVVKFRNTRQYLKLYLAQPEPVEYPKWDIKKFPRDVVNYLTQAEKDIVVDIDGRILERKLSR
ncbi:MAG: hypothetical protein HZB91_12545 [Elusimicrobia bacterium]|nr:hypothetical protein [Elusimicrobiota bacterium]